jgi:DME family drug/metabolite transporter
VGRFVAHGGPALGPSRDGSVALSSATDRSRAALAAACGAGALWGTGALVVNLLIARHGFSPETISFWRFVVGACVLLAVFGRPALWRAVRGHLGLLLAAGTCMALYVLCWFLGIERIGASIPTLIALCLPPVLVTVVAVLRGQERVDACLVAVLVAALAGTALIVAREGGSGGALPDGAMRAGVAFSVASAVLYAAFTLVSGRLAQDLGAGPMTTCLTVVAAVGVVTAALALLAFSWGAARLTPTALTVATLIEPLTAVALSALLLGEQLSAWQWLGGALLMGAIWGLSRRGSGAIHAAT